jgi:CRP-like cAMP-binding protein
LDLNKLAAMNVCKEHGWLARMPFAFRDQVLQSCDHIKLRAGQAVFEVGDEAGGIFGVASGRLGLHVPALGHEPTLSFVGGPGFWAGDLAAVAGVTRRTSLIACCETEVLRLSRASMMRLTMADPEAWLHFAELMAANFATSLATIGMLRRADPLARFASLLLNLAGLQQPMHTLTLSQAELAAMAAVSRTTTSNALGELEKRGLLRRGYSSITIIDFDGLAEVEASDSTAR